jgi:hypothetical protein
MCVHCMIERHPEIGRGLDIAREHLVADLDDEGVWHVGDKNRARGLGGNATRSRPFGL